MSKTPQNTGEMSGEECSSFILWGGSDKMAIELGRIFCLEIVLEMPACSHTFDVWSTVHILFVMMTNEYYNIYWGRFRGFNSWQMFIHIVLCTHCWYHQKIKIYSLNRKYLSHACERQWDTEARSRPQTLEWDFLSLPLVVNFGKYFPFLSLHLLICHKGDINESK